MPRSSLRTTLLLGSCLAGVAAIAAPPAANATGYGIVHGPGTVIVTPPAWAGYGQGHHPGVVTVIPVPGQAIALSGRRCDTVPAWGRRFNPGHPYASGWHPRSHYSQGYLPRSHFGGAFPQPYHQEQPSGFGRARIDIRF